MDFGELREDYFIFNILQKTVVNSKISAAVLDDKGDSVLGIFGRERRISRSRAEDSDDGSDILHASLQHDRIDFFFSCSASEQTRGDFRAQLFKLRVGHFLLVTNQSGLFGIQRRCLQKTFNKILHVRAPFKLIAFGNSQKKICINILFNYTFFRTVRQENSQHGTD